MNKIPTSMINLMLSLIKKYNSATISVKVSVFSWILKSQGVEKLWKNGLLRM